MRKIFYLLITLGLFLIAGCQQDEILPTQTEPVPPEPTSTPTITRTSTSTLTPTITRTSTPTLTSTITRTSTPTLTSTITLTPIPTLSSEMEQDAYVLDLIETNGGCAIPCWWGIEVGNSTWNDVSPIFRPLTHQEIPDGDNIFGYSQGIYDDPSITFGLTMYGESASVDYLTAFYFLVPDPGWNDYDVAVKRTFSLPTVLATNGRPSEIYLGAFGPAEPGSGVDERLFLVYYEPNIIIFYFLEVGYKNPWLSLDINEFCFYEDWLSMITLYTASEKADRNLFEIARIQDYIKVRYVSDFHQFTGLETEDFYNLVMSGETEPCFQLVNP